MTSKLRGISLYFWNLATTIYSYVQIHESAFYIYLYKSEVTKKGKRKRNKLAIKFFLCSVFVTYLISTNS